LALPVAHTVLIVDDHPSFRTIARLVLEGEGYEVVGDAASGEAGITEAVRLEPDVVLLDIGLPDMDGFSVATRIRGAGVGSAIVFTSTREAADFGPLLEDSGARGFIEKSELSGERLRALVA
jgi:DNA-binding NarL/FixJ family response regulator